MKSVSKRGGVSNSNGDFGEVDEIWLWEEQRTYLELFSHLARACIISGAAKDE